MALMWAYRLCAPSRFERADVPAPDPAALGDGQVLLRTTAGGICGSDTPRFRGRKGVTVDRHGRMLPGPSGYPMHEVVGEVVASRHPDVGTGSSVVGWATSTNGIAEFVVTSGDDVYEYGPSLEPAVAVLVQSLACVLYALERLDLRGAHVAVLGLGPIGLLFAHAASRAGAASVVGVDPVDRSGVASRFGLDRVVLATSGAWAVAPEGSARPDVVIEAVGHQVATLGHAIDAVAVEGRILYFGIPDDDVYPLPMEQLMRKNLTLIAGVTRRRREMLVRAVAYLTEHPRLASDLITAVYPVHEVQQAFDVATVADASRLKVVLTMS